MKTLPIYIVNRAGTTTSELELYLKYKMIACGNKDKFYYILIFIGKNF